MRVSFTRAYKGCIGLQWDDTEMYGAWGARMSGGFCRYS